MKVKVDRDVCIGSGGCAKSCPEVFRMEDGKATVYVPEVPSALEDKCKSVAQGCPSGAIKIEE
ncbi:MAG: ferredoxin [Candidatus Aceula meridiana]|nr:ferredoxin [Candidatus Aceula meridiana]